jgi:glycosyltransferase involved in cell wall biosynthesis
MLISVITASYNSEKTIKKTLQSVLNQSTNNFEHIIIDGNSNDNTISIIKSFEKAYLERNIPFKWISEEDSGIYDAWNKGIKMAQGDWISFLGSDDIYYRSALENYKKVIKESKDLDYISSKVKLVKADKVIKIISGKWEWKTFKRYMNVAHVGSLHSRKFFDKFGLYNTKYKIAGDYEMLLRANNSLNYLFLNEITAEMEDGGISNSMIDLALQETKRAKIDTGNVSKYLAFFDLCVAFLKAKTKILIS